MILLQGAFSEFALFFYDKYGGTFIAAVWKPAAFVPHPFKVYAMILMINYLAYIFRSLANGWIQKEDSLLKIRKIVDIDSSN